MRLARIFLLGASTLTVYRLYRGRVCEAFAFDDTESGHTAFARYLAEDDLTPAGLLVDRADEEFRVDTVPHVWTDRAALLARHSARMFRATPFRSASVLGREAGGRRDDRVLFSAIGRPEALNPWLDCVVRARVPLAVITSVAYVGARLLASFGSRGTLVLACFGADCGLRQSVFINGELRLSRLSMPTTSSLEIPYFAAEQIGRTVQYAQRMELIADRADVELHVIAGPEFTGPDPRVFAPSALHVHALPDVAHALECSEHAGRDMHVLYAELVARGEVNRYASPEQRRHYLQFRMAHVARVGSWGVALGAALAAMQNLGSAASAFEEAGNAQRQFAVMQTRQTAGDAPLTEAAQIREAVTRADHLLATRVPVSALLEPAGAVLARFPEFRLDALTFADVPGPDGDDDAAAAPRAMGSYRSVWLRGHVTAFGDDRRAAGARFDELVGALKNLPNAARVHVLEHPFDARGSLAGAASDRSASPAPRFGVQLTMTAS